MSTLDKYGRNPSGHIEELAYGATGGDMARVAPIDQRYGYNHNENIGNPKYDRIGLVDGQINLSVPFNDGNGWHYANKIAYDYNGNPILITEDNQGYPVVHDIPRSQPIFGHNTYYEFGEPIGNDFDGIIPSTGFFAHLDELNDEYEKQKAIQEYLNTAGAY